MITIIEINNTKKTFANLTKFGVISESLCRLKAYCAKCEIK
jgi:hypothetical protein